MTQFKKFQLLRTILIEIRDGKREHDQSTFHCGSSHCIAGWLEVEALKRVGWSSTFDENGNWVDSDGEKFMYSPEVEELDEELFYNPEKAPCFVDTDPNWGWAARYLELKNYQVIGLFMGHLMITEIIESFNNLCDELSFDELTIPK